MPARIAVGLAALVLLGCGVHAANAVVRLENRSSAWIVAAVEYDHAATGAAVRYHALRPGDRQVVGAVGHVVEAVRSFSILDADCELLARPPADANPSGDYWIGDGGELVIERAPLVLGGLPTSSRLRQANATPRAPRSN